jgi:hypothetical protein
MPTKRSLTGNGASGGMQHDEEKIFYDCFMCERRFQFGRYVYDGQYVSAWGVNICNRCRHNNCSGIDPAEHPRTVQLLKYRSAPIKLNANGRLEIPRGGPPQTISGGKTPEGL